MIQFQISEPTLSECGHVLTITLLFEQALSIAFCISANLRELSDNAGELASCFGGVSVGCRIRKFVIIICGQKTEHTEVLGTHRTCVRYRIYAHDIGTNWSIVRKLCPRTELRLCMCDISERVRLYRFHSFANRPCHICVPVSKYTFECACIAEDESFTARRLHG